MGIKVSMSVEQLNYAVVEELFDGVQIKLEFRTRMSEARQFSVGLIY